MGLKRNNVLAGLVVALACSQMVGYLTGAKTVSACGAGLCFAPMAEVFSEVRAPGENGRHLEPYALAFTLRGVDADGVKFERAITPENLGRIEGPHARRAVYGAAFAAGPAAGNHEIDAPWENVWRFGFGEDGPLRAAFDLPDQARGLSLLVETRTKGRDDAWVLSPDSPR